MGKKQLVVMSGVPGSGKSTLVLEFVKAAVAHELEVVVCSADDHHIETDDGGREVYVFKPAEQGLAHAKCRQKAYKALLNQNVDVVLVDNTNVGWDEFDSYIYMALDPRIDASVLRVLMHGYLGTTDHLGDSFFARGQHPMPRGVFDNKCKKWDAEMAGPSLSERFPRELSLLEFRAWTGHSGGKEAAALAMLELVRATRRSHSAEPKTLPVHRRESVLAAQAEALVAAAEEGDLRADVELDVASKVLTNTHTFIDIARDEGALSADAADDLHARLIEAWFNTEA